MKISFNYKGKKHFIDVKKVKKSSFGLMFKSKKTKPLLFSFDKPSNFKITSLFVFFEFVAIWMDENNKIIEIKKIKPFTISIKPKKSFKKLIEIPINDKNKDIIKLLVGD